MRKIQFQSSVNTSQYNTAYKQFWQPPYGNVLMNKHQFPKHQWSNF